MADKGQQTEQPTPRRLEKARREGRFPVSREFVSSVQFLAFAISFAAFGPEAVDALCQLLRHFIALAFGTELGHAQMVWLSITALKPLLAPLGATGAILLSTSMFTHLATTRLGFAPARLAPDLKNLNFLSRARNLPKQNFRAVLSAILLLPVFGLTVYLLVADNLPSLARLPLQSAGAGAVRIGQIVKDLIWKSVLVLLAFGAIDLFRQRRQFLAEMRMTKQEVREEAKELEGNPQMKGRIRRLQREVSRRRMMEQIPQATAVVVNPTHYAVAVRYLVGSAAAPTVVAKGKNYLARRIRERAIEHQVPIVENPPLAQALYKSVEIGQEIPPHLYRAVAEILAYIFKLMNGRLPG
jgi:flagellar biosynthetic protein FlhB